MAQISPVERTSMHSRSKRPLQLDPVSVAVGSGGQISREISQAFILPDPDGVDVEHGVDYLGQNNNEQR